MTRRIARDTEDEKLNPEDSNGRVKGPIDDAGGGQSQELMIL